MVHHFGRIISTPQHYSEEADFTIGTRMSVGKENLMRWLLAHGADPNVVHDQAPSPLVSAVVAKEGGDAMRLLLEHGAALEPNILHYVIGSRERNKMSDIRERVQQLVRAGAEINHIDPKRKGTPLHCAAWHYRGDIVEAVIELGADPNVVFDGRTAADVAKDKSQDHKAYLTIYDFLKDKTKVTPEE